MAGNYERVMEERKKLVDQIINNMKEGYLIPKPQWNQNIFRIINPVSGVRYRGANMLKLYMSSVVNGYQDNRWMTYKQAESKGYHVKKGETGIRLEKYIFEKQVEQENDITGQKEKVWVKLSKPMINTFVVFNGEQIDGIPDLVHQEIKQQDSEVWKIADDLIASSECPVMEEPQGNAFYSPQHDSITLPPREVFISPEAFTTTLIHEMCHSTGHETRLNRPILNKFGSPEYALEELRAELGAFFMGSDLGIEGSEELLASHTQYLESWITVLENDPNELFRAMSDSQKAVDRLSANYEKVREQLIEVAAHQDIETLQQYEQFTQFHHSKISSLDAECKSIVINAFGGPGSGKSVSCMDICQQLKKLGYNAEYVQEYAKELVYAEDWEQLDGLPEHQFEILREQLARIDRLYGKVDFIVTDAPILLNGIYNKSLTPEYDQMVTNLYKDFENFTYFVERDASFYQQEGRIQNLAESQKIDQTIKNLLRDKGVYFGIYNHGTIDKIVNNSIATYNRINNVVKEAESLKEGDEMLEPEVGLEKEKNMSQEQIEDEYGRVEIASLEKTSAEPIKMDLDEYLGSKGLSSPVSDYTLDKLKIPNGETYRQKQQRFKNTNEAIDEYHQRRNEAISEYNAKVESGEYVPKTTFERTLKIAQGHPYNEATQAARRMLVKKGFMSEEELNDNIRQWDAIPTKVAIESTIDYSEPEVGFVSVATDNMPAGTKYRLVTFGDKGNLVPYQEPDVIYLNREELQDYIEAHKDALEVVNYDDMVYQAGKLKSEYTSQQHEIIESGLHSFEFEDGYLYFSLDVNGNSFDGLYRIYDPVNGKSREIVSFNDYDPVIKENWDFIERRLTQYVNEHPEIGLNGEQIPRERPSIYCEWSEHGAFREGTVYTPSEFSMIMEESDNEWIKLREMEQQQYGKDAFDILMDQGLPQHQTYAKVKYEIYIPGMEPLTVRQDIGDGFGSVYSFLKRNGYMEYANNLIKNMSDVQIQERLNYIHTNYVNMLGDIQKFARFEIDDLHGEQDCRELYKKTEKVAIESSIKESTNNNNQSNIPSAEKIDAAINDVMEQINIQIAEPNFALEL